MSFPMMKKLATWFFVAVVIIGMPKTAYAEKPIVGSVEFLPNYLWHLFAVSNVFDLEENEYADRYRETVEHKDAAYLYKHRQLIAWGNSVTNFFTTFLFFVPAAKNYKTKAGLKEYLNKVQAGFDDSFQDYVTDFPNLISKNQINGLMAKQKNHSEIFRGFSAIILKYFDVYQMKIWPHESRKLKTVAEAITKHFKGKNLIEKWENRLKKHFQGERFEIVLTTANKNMPSANNLTWTRYNFYYQPHSFDKLVDFISHEIGTNLLIPLKNELNAKADLITRIRTAGLSRMVIWRAFETLAEYNNSVILGIPPVVWQGKMFNGEEYDFPIFFAFYGDLYKTNPEISAKEAMKAGIEHYIDARAKKTENKPK